MTGYPPTEKYTFSEYGRTIFRRTFAVGTMAALLMSAMITPGCTSRTGTTTDGDTGHTAMMNGLQDSLNAIASRCPGEIGIALLTGDGDTLTVNNEDKYPLMSVFKLHQAIALCHSLEQSGTPLDTVLRIPRGCLNPDTWSPMLREHTSDTLVLSVRSMLEYTLTQSDNNASNYLFEHMLDVDATDRFIATLIPRSSFRLSVTEARMWADHSMAAANHSSPLGAALLIDRLYNDSILGAGSLDFIRTVLRQCQTGTDRIVRPLTGHTGVTAGHKTGSGFRTPQGILAAHNDVAYVSLPDGSHYTLSVLVKDFDGSEEEASDAIADISEAVFRVLGDGGKAQ